MNAFLVAASSAEQCLATQILRRCPKTELAAAKVLAAVEPPDSKLLVVLRGVVMLVAAGDGRRSTVVALAREGDVLAPPGRDEHVRALTEARVLAVPPDAFEALVGFSGVAQELLESLLDALGKRHRSLASARSPHADRLQKTLFQLAREHGKARGDGVEIDLPLTHELLAQMVGSARETVTCALTRLQREGRLVRDGRTYRLIVAPELLVDGPPGPRRPARPVTSLAIQHRRH